MPLKQSSKTHFLSVAIDSSKIEYGLDLYQAQLQNQGLLPSSEEAKATLEQAHQLAEEQKYNESTESYERAAALYELQTDILKVQTVADSISVGYPRDQIKALRAVHQSGGTFISVSDAEILEAVRFLAGNGGIFVEPAAAAAFAGLRRLQKDEKIQPEQTAVVLLTGSGLKDIKALL